MGPGERPGAGSGWRDARSDGASRHNGPVPAADLLSRHHAEWAEAVEHRFLRGVRDGSLGAAAFQFWLQQDHLFVADLLSFQARLLGAAPRPAQRVLASGLVGLEAELTWFEASASLSGVTLPLQRSPVTASYRLHLEHFLAQSFEVGMTALWALELVYLEAWRRASPGASPFRPYVEHWSTPAFATYVAELEPHAVDQQAAESAFVAVSELERRFWDEALTLS